MIDTPEKLKEVVARARASGIGVCLRLGLICRPTREEAVAAAEALLPGDMKESTTTKDDSQMYKEGTTAASDVLAEPLPFYRACAALRPGMDDLTRIAEAACRGFPYIQANRRHRVHHFWLTRARLPLILSAGKFSRSYGTPSGERDKNSKQATICLTDRCRITSTDQTRR